MPIVPLIVSYFHFPSSFAMNEAEFKCTLSNGADFIFPVHDENVSSVQESTKNTR